MAAEAMIEEVKESDVKRVVLEIVDIYGVSRSEQVSTEYFVDSWEDGYTYPIAIISCTPRTVPAPDSRYTAASNYPDGYVLPDPETFKLVPWLPDTGRVLCDFAHADGTPVGAYPRELLRRVLRTVPPEFEFSVGSELEFYLLDENHDPVTPHRHEAVSWMTEEVSGWYDTLDEWAGVYELPLELMHHEYGPGQFEVLFGYGDPMTQADRAFDFKRLVKQTSRTMDRRATFMSKPFPDESGSGYHLHVGLTVDGSNAFADGEGLSERARQFVGGLLEHADALTALQVPTLNAHKRYEPGGFVPSTASWGFGNRMAAVRIPIGEPRIEVRIGGADANPYVVIASTLAAGLHGIEAELDPGEPVEGDPAGDRPDLLRRPWLALEALEEDEYLREALGEEFVHEYVAVRRQDLAAFREAVTDWERESYVEML